MNGQSTAAYRTIISELASRDAALRTLVSYLVLLYYADDQIAPGGFVTYKILPFGQGK